VDDNVAAARASTSNVFFMMMSFIYKDKNESENKGR
jgi:hypothetical protein